MLSRDAAKWRRRPGRTGGDVAPQQCHDNRCLVSADFRVREHTGVNSPGRVHPSGEHVQSQEAVLEAAAHTGTHTLWHTSLGSTVSDGGRLPRTQQPAGTPASSSATPAAAADDDADGNRQLFLEGVASDGLMNSADNKQNQVNCAVRLVFTGLVPVEHVES